MKGGEKVRAWAMIASDGDVIIMPALPFFLPNFDNFHPPLSVRSRNHSPSAFCVEMGFLNQMREATMTATRLQLFPTEWLTCEGDPCRGGQSWGHMQR